MWGLRQEVVTAEGALTPEDWGPYKRGHRHLEDGHVRTQAEDKSVASRGWEELMAEVDERIWR